MSYGTLGRAVVLGGLLTWAVLQPCLADTPVSPASFVVAPNRTLTQGTQERLSQLPRHEARQSSGSGSTDIGSKPPAFTAKDLQGKTASLSQYKGKIVLLDFWATWCEPCCEELPNVVAAYNKYHSQGFDVLAISLDSSRSDLVDYIHQHNVPYRQVFDGNGWSNAVAKLYNVDSIPHSILIGRDGTILAVDPRGDALVPAIQRALGGKKSSTQATQGAIYF